MRMETGTFELRGNDMMMRELTDAEINEVAGGAGSAAVSAIAISGAGSSLTTLASNFALSTSNTTASASIAVEWRPTGPNNAAQVAAAASVV